MGLVLRPKYEVAYECIGIWFPLENNAHVEELWLQAIRGEFDERTVLIREVEDEVSNT
jgi:hypothetical protein